MEISVLARESKLSRMQVEEIASELQFFYPELYFKPIFIKTRGDLDRKTSLRALSKCDFFTREIDEMQLQGVCRLSIHSAKDLPEPLREGLTIGALTRGVDPSDSLVFRERDSLECLSRGAKIATSSDRREDVVRRFRRDLTFVDLRGTVDERLELLFSGQIDGVVIAEAALIRLKLTHLNRMRLPGETVPLQGRLAVVCLSQDREMKELLKVIDS